MSRSILLTAVMAMVLTGCAKDSEKPADEYINEATVQAGAVSELCFRALKDDELVFRFEADQPLEFNLHYHIDDVVYYPVPEHTTAAEKGQYLVPKDETYCLMWTNTSDADIDLTAQVNGASDFAWY